MNKQDMGFIETLIGVGCGLGCNILFYLGMIVATLYLVKWILL